MHVRRHSSRSEGIFQRIAANTLGNFRNIPEGGELRLLVSLGRQGFNCTLCLWSIQWFHLSNPPKVTRVFGRYLGLSLVDRREECQLTLLRRGNTSVGTRIGLERSLGRASGVYGGGPTGIRDEAKESLCAILPTLWVTFETFPNVVSRGLRYSFFPENSLSAVPEVCDGFTHLLLYAFSAVPTRCSDGTYITFGQYLYGAQAVLRHSTWGTPTLSRRHAVGVMGVRGGLLPPP
jgi:hypothetical protein